MKATRLTGLYYWAEWQPDRRIDFCAYYWRRPDGAGVLIDPLRIDAAHSAELAEPIGWILLTNADHRRASAELAQRFGARIVAPDCDRVALAGLDVADWYGPNAPLPDALRCDIDVSWLHGGKTEYEAALYLRELRALLFGDAVRSHVSGELRLLPDTKVSDGARLAADVARATNGREVTAVLLGDGDPIFVGAEQALARFRA